MEPNIVIAALIAGTASLGITSSKLAVHEPSIFPPLNGPITLPTTAQGYYQGRGDEFLRPLSGAEQQIWAGLDGNQKLRAATFIRNGGTLVSSFGSDF